MLPIFVIMGFAAGVTVSTRAAFRHVALIGLCLSLLWSIVIGMSNGSASTLGGAFVLAAVNLMFAVLAGVIARRMSLAFTGRRTTSSPVQDDPPE